MTSNSPSIVFPNIRGILLSPIEYVSELVVPPVRLIDPIFTVASSSLVSASRKVMLKSTDLVASSFKIDIFNITVSSGEYRYLSVDKSTTEIFVSGMVYSISNTIFVQIFVSPVWELY